MDISVYRRHAERIQTAALIGAGLLLAVGQAGAESWGPLPNPPEPTVPELLREAKQDDRDPAALLRQLDTLLRYDPAKLDAWIPTLRRHEHWDLTSAAQKLGYGARSSDNRWVKALPGMVDDLRNARLRHPARVVDAILRRLEEVGTPDQIGPLLETATRAGTEWGRWKVYATVQGILARSPTADVLKHCPGVSPVLAQLLRDLSPEKRGELAAAYLRRRANYDGWPTVSVTSSLWLAWSLSSADPEGALSIFRLGLELPDPATRLFAGLGIARMTDGRIPYRLTANRRTTEAERVAWLKGLTPHKPDDWYFPDPLDRPVVRHYLSSRADLWWLTTDGQVARRQEDVWPGVIRVLPDGTFYTAMRSVALTDPDGEVMARLPGGWGTVDNSARDGHGGFVALEDNERRLVEYALSGEKLWECPLDDGHTSARNAAVAGPGQILLVRYRTVQILNRRGDVVWSVRGELDDPRWACAIDPDTVLVACKTAVELYHRTRGRIAQVAGFTSVSDVRYHPTKPWMVIDAGMAVLQDVQRGTAVRVKIGSGNSDPPLPSRWVRPAHRHP